MTLVDKLFGKFGKSAQPKNPAQSHSVVKPLKTKPPEYKVTGKATAYLTTAIAGSKARLVIAQQEIDLSKDWFYNKVTGKSYGIEPQKPLLFNPQKSVFVYDKDFFEPLDSNVELAGMEPHWSARADQLLRLGFVRQSLGSAGGAVQENWKDWALKLGLGVALGYLLGNTLTLSSFGVGVSPSPNYPVSSIKP